MKGPPQTIAPLTWVFLVLLGLLWGASFFFARVAVEQVPPLTLVLLRVFLAAVALHLYLWGRHDLYRELLTRWRAFILLGTVNNVIPFTLIFVGQTEIGAGLAATLNATTPLFTVIIANRLTTDEKMTIAKLAGCLLGLAGTAVLIGPSAATGLGAPIWAQLAIIGAAISYGFAAIYIKTFRQLSPTVTATGQLTASSLVMLPLVLFIDHPWTLEMPSADIIVAILMLAVVSTSLGYILYFRIIRDAGATSGSIVTLLVPPSAILLGVVFLGEQLSLEAVLGFLLIACGLLVIDGRITAYYRKNN